ncbi:hypothetical protein ACVWXL_006330 [Bradyrhizobium sp. GM22.5]
MIRASGTAGFQGPPATVSSSRLTNAVAASLAVAALSLCLDRHPDGAVDQGDHGDGPAGLIPASSWTRLQGAAWPAPTGIATGRR